MESSGFLNQMDETIVGLATYYIHFVYPMYINPKPEIDNFLMSQIVKKMLVQLEQTKEKTKLATLYHHLNMSIKTINEILKAEETGAIIAWDKTQKRSHPKFFWKQKLNKKIREKKKTLKTIYGNLLHSYETIISIAYSINYGLMREADAANYIL